MSQKGLYEHYLNSNKPPTCRAFFTFTSYLGLVQAPQKLGDFRPNPTDSSLPDGALPTDSNHK